MLQELVLNFILVVWFIFTKIKAADALKVYSVVQSVFWIFMYIIYIRLLKRNFGEDADKKTEVDAKSEVDAAKSEVDSKNISMV